MIPRLTVDACAVKHITSEQFETYRDYYTRQMLSFKGRRGALTAQEIKAGICDLGGEGKLRRLFCNSVKSSQELKKSNGQKPPREHEHTRTSSKREDMEIYFILKANARGRRTSITSSVCY